MRRRLWCQIAICDTVAAHNIGLHQPDSNYNMVVPSNVNDIDISPSMKHSPEERVGATDMIFCNLRYKIMNFMSEVNGGRRPWTLPVGEQRTLVADEIYHKEREKSIEGMEEQLELELLRYCDMLNPVHSLTIVVARLTLCKLRYTVLKPCEYGKDPKDCTKEHGRVLFSKALKVLEYENSANRQDFMQGFLWHTQQYLQWTCLTQVLEELKIGRHDEQLDRAWEQICIFYESRPKLYQRQKRKPSLHKTINKMTIEAWQIRETQALGCGKTLVTPTFITLLKKRSHQAKYQSKVTAAVIPFVGGPSQVSRDQADGSWPSAHSNIEYDLASWPDWTGFDLAVPNGADNDAYFLGSTTDEDIFMSTRGNNTVPDPPQGSVPQVQSQTQGQDKW